jgi:23S rRNA (cytosine1962-C5)-methyltransferase
MSGFLFLKPGREKSVLQKHPWIFSGAIERVTGEPGVGETVEIRSSDGKFLARAAYSLTSQIRARIWSWVEAEEIGVDFLRRKLAAAVGSREHLLADPGTTAFRLVHAESDGLPGLVVDRYGDVLVMQCLSTGADLWRNELAAILANLTGCRSIYERSDVDIRGLEGLPARIGPIYGPDVEGPLEILENGLKFQVDVRTGHKTGFYLDQRRNRRRLQDFSRGKSVLNCFCYTGGFSVYALAGGAGSVVSVDSSEGALEMGRENLRINGLDDGKARWEEADVFEYLRGQRDRAAKYDLIILDPPKFAPTIRHAEKAARAYKDINLLAFKLLKPDGYLFTFSCSGGVSADLFQKIVAGAALDAGVDARIIDYLHQGEDHPVSLNFPEGAYLKGLICQVGE